MAGLLTTPFGATTTAMEVIEGIHLRGRRALVTGGSSGIGVETAPFVEGVSGRYFEDCNEAGPHQPGIRRAVEAYAIDPENAARLWEISQNMLNEAQ